jgi:Ca-activated chloride channel family protein
LEISVFGTDIEFAYPWVLAGLLAVPLLALVMLRLRPDRLRGGVVLSTLGPLTRIAPAGRARWRRLLLPLRLAGLALLIVALARPQTVKADARVETQGIDIVLAFDISGSMQEPGLGARTKMEGAKKALKDFIDGRENDRIGLVVFKSEQRTMAPLTLDYRALTQMIDDVEKQNEGLPDGTAIGLGIADSVNLLRNSRTKSRIIILATDGQNNERRVEPEQAAAIAETLKVRLYTIGLVTQNARAEATLDEQQMRRISERTGGSYARATDAGKLREIYDNVANLEKSRFERQRLVRYNELANWLLIPGIGLLLLGVLLDTTWLRRAP